MSQSAQKQNYNRPLLILRSTLFWIWSIACTLIMAVPVVGGGLFSYRVASEMARLWMHLNLFGLRTICGLRCNTDGLANIPDTPCIVMSKHQSTWETYYLPTVLPRSVYVAKKSLLWIPIVGWALLVLRFIMIDRKSGHTAVSQMVTQADERMKQGMSVIIFPEGTRVPLQAPPNYRIGGAVVAEQTQRDVLPVALNTGEFWPRLGFIKWPGEITVSFGPVIKSEGKTAQQILQETEHWIETRMQEISVPDRFPY
ncbi:hypothetical protein AB833_26420 [Chromatiales bacterium (ex Bugula neritina AB1)]|nr:hypothetical protein AB833_26420 [Chromatiales bacterium (ex Bugula neritina AB1)]